ncbi:hypothetical protein BGX26_000583 [Mortierella sp. AD094]|nr:hypothetical protein BGX26_000583 [Mortierella sp. AD094]
MEAKDDNSLPPYSAPAEEPYQQTPQMSSVTPQVAPPQAQVYPPPQAQVYPPPQSQVYPPPPCQQGQQPFHQPPYQGQQYVPPVQVNQRNEALIARYRQEISENEIGCPEICWFLCCGFFGLICCLPKYHAQQRAKTNLKIELAKAPGQP